MKAKNILGAMLASAILCTANPAPAQNADLSGMSAKEFAEFLANYDMALGNRFLSLTDKQYQTYKALAPVVSAEFARRSLSSKSFEFEIEFDRAVKDALGKRLSFYTGSKMPATLGSGGEIRKGN